MSSVWAHGKKLYARIKGYKAPGQWATVPTDYRPGQESEAKRWADRMEEGIAKRGAPDGPLTLARYALGEPHGGRLNWIERRKALGVHSWGVEEGCLRLHILPVLGDLAIGEVRAKHVRDLMTALATAGVLGTRRRREIYAVLGRLYSTALGDELGIEASPCQLKRGNRELPTRRDVDPEWRGAATYIQHEVERLVSDSAIAVERRVQYALKSIGMLRHEEVAALRWRRYDPTLEPLGQLAIVAAYDSRAGVERGPKGDQPRAVPVHPVLAKLLAEWKLTHWPRIYGRAATDDDLIVPNLAFGFLDGSKAARLFPQDLATLGLRVRAGKFRNRGGHDLRAWGITRYQEHGAHRDILKLSSHGSGRAVLDGYTRVGWVAQCAEISKLKIALLDGEILSLATGLTTRSAMQRNYLGKARVPGGQLAPQMTASIRECEPKSADLHDPSEHSRIAAVASLATGLAAAVLAGDLDLARKLASELHELTGGAATAPNVRPITSARRARASR